MVEVNVFVPAQHRSAMRYHKRAGHAMMHHTHCAKIEFLQRHTCSISWLVLIMNVLCCHISVKLASPQVKSKGVLILWLITVNQHNIIIQVEHTLLIQTKSYAQLLL